VAVEPLGLELQLVRNNRAIPARMADADRR
jgi:hypothetical protein